MDKKNNLIFMLLIFAGVFLGVQYFTQQDKPDQQQSQPTAEKTQQQLIDEQAASIPANQWLIQPGKAQSVTLGDSSGQGEFLLSIDVDSTGGSIRTATLRDYFETVEDKQLYDKDPGAYAKARKDNPKKYQGHYKVLRDINYDGESYRSLATRLIKLYPGEGKDPVYFTEPRIKAWHLVKQTTDPTTKAQSAVFEWTIYYNKSKDLKKNEGVPYVTLRKIYTVLPDSYSVDVRFEAVSHVDTPVKLDVQLSGPVGLNRQAAREDLRMVIAAKLIDKEIQPITHGNKDLIEWPYGQPHKLGSSTELKEPMVWYGMINKYFGSMVYVEPDNPDQLYNVATEVDYYATPIQASKYDPKGDPGRAWDSTMWVRNIELKPKQTKGFDINLFVGPKDRDMFKANPLYAKLRYVDSIVTQGCVWCTFNWLMELLLGLLTFFAETLFFGNYGLAIMLLVLIVRLALHPLTKKGQVSMMSMQKRMAVLKPQMDKIRQQYANDKARMNTELMKLNKEHGNPMTEGLTGCLPMLLQMPIWVALYSALSTSVALRHAAFLPFWITDLAAPDQLFVLSTPLPLIGSDINLLPVLLTIAMFFQQKYMSPPPTDAMSDEQKQQQKMMRIMMPLMMLFIFYKLPSGLNLYIMASSTIGVIEQMRIRKHIKDKEALEEAAAGGEIVVEAGSRALRGKRPKKPKGPFNVK